MRAVKKAKPSSSRSTSGSAPRSTSRPATLGLARPNDLPISRRYASSLRKYLLNMNAPWRAGSPQLDLVLAPQLREEANGLAGAPHHQLRGDLEPQPGRIRLVGNV